MPPSPADLEAAKNRTIPDILPPPGEQLLVLFCGINPSLYSAATGWHFARPGNRFWPALHLSGFTPRQLAPSEQHLLPGYGLGITNLVVRATAQAAELTPAELKTGGERLGDLVSAHRPRVLAIAGVTAYRTAFARPRAAAGPQPDPLAATPVWVLPNPSGLNAHTSVPLLAEDMRRLREALDDGELCRRLSSRTFTTPDSTCPAVPARHAGPSWVLLPARVSARCYRRRMAYPLITAQTHLGELVAEARQSHRPVAISEDGKTVAALINIDDLADLEDRAALAAHLTDKAAGRDGVTLDELDAALDRIEAETSS